jgi:hypothetical protein
MKKILLISLLVLCFLLLTVTETQARSERYCSQSSYLNLSLFQHPKGVGFKQRLFRNVYASGQLDYISSVNDLEIQTGALYMIPRKIFIFQFYGGAGLQFSRNSGYQYPYLNFGTRFLFLFSEVFHPLERQATPKYRFGLSFSF